MRSPFVWLPSLMLFGAALMLNAAAGGNAIAGPKTTEAEVRALEQERKEISERLDRLAVEKRHMLPRGGI